MRFPRYESFVIGSPVDSNTGKPAKGLKFRRKGAPRFTARKGYTNARAAVGTQFRYLGEPLGTSDFFTRATIAGQHCATAAAVDMLVIAFEGGH